MRARAYRKSTLLSLVSALALVRKKGSGVFSPEKTPDPFLIDSGLAWLTAHQNDDGGWGDTVRSKSNISTTAPWGRSSNPSSTSSAAPESR